ncbi:uncharacterized protein BDV14DRAFT_198883 [Aspergillus stella-maris]|uniref:uncharacterized protein n=1 Tax=Aspergillus stella-maris TaxID=1810926 RepID=UPI003CCD14D4
MQFKLSAIAALASVAAASPVLNARETTCAADAVTAINGLTEASRKIGDSAATLTFQNIIVKGPQIIQGTVQIAQTTAAGVGLPCNGELTQAEQQKICNATSELILAEEDLLKAISSKQGVLGATPFGAPVAAAGEALERTTDKLLFEIVDSTPACGKSLDDLRKALDQDFQDLQGALRP